MPIASLQAIRFSYRCNHVEALLPFSASVNDAAAVPEDASSSSEPLFRNDCTPYRWHCTDNGVSLA
jgi:hypothetical protein